MDAERTYRLAMAAYPARFRHERADEVITVLMATEPGHASVREALSLVRHGLAMRLRGPARPHLWRPAAAPAAMALATLLAVVGLGQLVRLGATPLLGSADGLGALPDPLWPVKVLWLLTFGLLVLRAGRLAATSAWAAVAAYLALGLTHLETNYAWALGNLQQNWLLLSPLVPTAALALLLLLPSVAATARQSIGAAHLRVASIGGGLLALWSVWTGGHFGLPASATLVVLVAAFVRQGVLLRAGMLVGTPVLYVALGTFTRGSAYLPSAAPMIVVVLVTVPLVAAGLALALLPVVGSAPVRRTTAGALDRLAAAVRDGEPDRTSTSSGHSGT